MSGKKLLRKLAIGFGVLMLFLVIDIAVAWYLNPKAQTPVQAVRMEATRAAAEIIAKTMKTQIQKQEQAAPAASAPAPEQPAAQPDQPQTQTEQPQVQTEQKGTQLEDIEAEDNILVYTIKVQANGAEFDFVMRKLRADLFPSGCTRPEYERLLEYGLGVTLDFRSQDGRKQVEITFTPEICGYTRIEQPPQAPAQPPQPAPAPQQPEQQLQQAEPQLAPPEQPQQPAAPQPDQPQPQQPQQ
jgi:hypothetical protein